MTETKIWNVGYTRTISGDGVVWVKAANEDEAKELAEDFLNDPLSVDPDLIDRHDEAEWDSDDCEANYADLEIVVNS